MNSMTALLTVYKRPYALAEQLAAIRRQTLRPDAIWCFVQEPSVETSHIIHCSGFDRVIECTPNSFFHFRFACAMAAQTDFVAIFDDDAIPGDRWLENCLQTFQQFPGILGTHGTVMKDLENYRNRERFGWLAPSPLTIEVDYVGQVWWTRPEWIRFLFAEKLCTDRNGEDIEFSARAWRHGRIRSFCPAHYPNDVSGWGCLNNDLNSDNNASCKRPTWQTERLEILKSEAEAGWQILSQREALLPING